MNAKKKKNIYIYIYIFIYLYILPFNYRAQPKIAVHCSCGAKKYCFGSTIARYILSFSGAKNSYMPI